jgi:hypothetical protein
MQIFEMPCKNKIYLVWQYQENQPKLPATMNAAKKIVIENGDFGRAVAPIADAANK